MKGFSKMELNFFNFNSIRISKKIFLKKKKIFYTVLLFYSLNKLAELDF